MSKRNKPEDVFRRITMGPKDKCWPWTGPVSGRDRDRPYMSIGGQATLVYRIVYELVHGVRLGTDDIVRHTCDNSLCCNPEHLIIGSHQQNMDDMKERERHGLPHNTVKAIKRLIAAGVHTQEEIAAKYGVSRENVSKIATGRLYSHVLLEEKEVDNSDSTLDTAENVE